LKIELLRLIIQLSDSRKCVRCVRVLIIALTLHALNTQEKTFINFFLIFFPLLATKASKQNYFRLQLNINDTKLQFGLQDYNKSIGEIKDVR